MPNGEFSGVNGPMPEIGGIWAARSSLKQILYIFTPWNTVQGGQIPEMIQVYDYDILIVLGELNTLI